MNLEIKVFVLREKQVKLGCAPVRVRKCRALKIMLFHLGKKLILFIRQKFEWKSLTFLTWLKL